MGIVYADVEIRSESGPWRIVPFLVDSGAAYSVLPHDVWRELRLHPMRRQRFALADGTAIERGISECRFRYHGVDATSPVVLGEMADAALLGAVTLETLGLVLNPFDRTLRPMPMVLMDVRAASACAVASAR
jgi:clan AA aspartic protease